MLKERQKFKKIQQMWKNHIFRLNIIKYLEVRGNAEPLEQRYFSPRPDALILQSQYLAANNLRAGHDY